MTLTFNTHITSLTKLVVCIYQHSGQRLQNLKNPLFSLFPIEKPNYFTCLKIGRPRVTIYISFVELESSMLHTKFQDHRTFGSGEEDF